MNTYQYRCVVHQGTCTPAATSVAATLNFNIAPSVSVQPSPSTILADLILLLASLLLEQDFPTNGRKARMAGTCLE